MFTDASGRFALCHVKASEPTCLRGKAARSLAQLTSLPGGDMLSRLRQALCRVYGALLVSTPACVVKELLGGATALFSK